MSIFLTKTEIAELTGYQTRSKQALWLADRGWKFEMSALGHVKVLRKYAEMKLGMPIDGKYEQTTEPDFSSLAS